MEAKHVSIVAGYFRCYILLAFNYFSDHLGKIRDFLIWIKDNLLRERPELFIQNDSV